MSFIEVFKEAFSGFRRAKFATAVSIITMMLALLLLGSFYIISTNTSRIVHSIRGKIEMEVFLAEPATNDRVEEIRKHLLAVQGIAGVQYISKDEAAKIFKEEFGEDINKVLDFNPLPPSFKISLKEEYQTSTKAVDVEKSIKAIAGIDNVIYRREMLEFVEKQAHTLYNIGLVLGILIGISAIFLVANTIRLTMYAKQTSIGISKLKSAPFIIEGIFQGIIGGLLAVGLLYYTLTSATGIVSGELADFLKVDQSVYWLIVLVGVLLGLFGSAISVLQFNRKNTGKPKETQPNIVSS